MSIPTDEPSAVTNAMIPTQSGPGLGDGSPPQSPPPAGDKPIWYRRRWVQLVATALVAVAVGGAAGSSSASEADARAAAAEQRAETAEGRASEAEADAKTAQASVAEAQKQAAGAKAAAEASLAERAAQLDAENAKVADGLKAREDRVAGQEAALLKREQAVGIAEAEAKANEFDGDGIYLVGSDIKPGTYKAGPSPRGNCYYARLSSASGGFGSIIANNNTEGPVVLVVKASDVALEVSGCGTFRKTG